MALDSPATRFIGSSELATSGREGYLRSLLEGGATAIAENALVEVRALAVGSKTLPVLVMNPADGNSSVCSEIAHHVRYPRDELMSRAYPSSRWFLRWAFRLFEWALALGRIDRVVYLNNWLYSTNPPLELSVTELAAVRRFLLQAYPNHAQVVRSVQPILFPDQRSLFAGGGYSLIKSRDVFVWPSGDRSYEERKNYRIDRRFLAKSNFRIVECDNLETHEARRLRELYRALYLDKHSPLNPRLTERFFASTCKSGALQYRLVTLGGEIVGFYCFDIFEDVMTPVVLGYDLSIARAKGLYRVLIMSCLREAQRLGLSLSLSAGVGEFKASRGGQSTTEYEAVAFEHLPLRQRSAWRLLAKKGEFSAFLRSTFWRYGNESGVVHRG